MSPSSQGGFRQQNHPIQCAIFIALCLSSTSCFAANELAGRAVLPAATFAEGPSSGQYIGKGPINFQRVPFKNKQPVQGVSAVVDLGNGDFGVMLDNGYGSMENSADFNLRAYLIHPNFKTATGGAGNINVGGFIELHDPDKKIPFAITNQFTKDRVLTGADFDLESVQRAKDGTLWFGDEFGPFILHTKADGKIIEGFQLPDFNPAYAGKFVRSPQNPLNEEASAVRIMNAVRSHAQLYGNFKTPVFSPYHVELKFPADSKFPASSPDEHYARGKNTPADLKVAASDIFDIKSIQAAGYSIVTWTVNDSSRMNLLLAKGVNGIISDRSDLLLDAVRKFDANGDGVLGDYIGADGLIDITKFDAQGHRGSRDLRPENTLPAFEAALDNLMTTLETDTGITKDGIPVHSHDPYIEAAKCRRADGAAYAEKNQLLIKDLTVAELQSKFVCDKVFRGASQTNDLSLSPVAVAFAKKQGLPNPYVMHTTQQFFDFVKFYADYYQTGDGNSHPDASLRWRNAQKVRFNIETKVNPRSDKDNLGNVYKDRTIDYSTFAETLANVIEDNAMQDRADIQSFDFRTLLYVQKYHPTIRTVYLFGDFPIITDPARLADSDDGTNMQDENGKNTPWMAGLYWPYRETVQSNPVRAKTSGGFEGMAINASGDKLYPLLEVPLDGDDSKTLLIHEFDLKSNKYTGVQYKYPLEAAGNHIGEFILNSPDHGIIIERDGTQGNLNGFKRIYEVNPGAAGAPLVKRLAVDLMKLSDPSQISLPGLVGDVGLGANFAFPFVTIESVVLLAPNLIGVLNDNNYPFSIGRHVGSGRPDDEEFIVIKLDQPLQSGGFK